MDRFEQNIPENVVLSDLIPQKYPFVMVDKLLHYSDKNVVSGLTITNDNIFYNNQYFTESGLIEHMAQTVALYTGYQYYLLQKPAPTGYIGSIKSVEILKLPKLKEQLITTATILHEIMGVTLVHIVVTLNEETIAISEMKTVIAK